MKELDAMDYEVPNGVHSNRFFQWHLPERQVLWQILPI